MESGRSRNVLFLAPFCDGNDVGESFNSHKWASALARHVNLTVLSLHRHGQVPLAEQLPGARTCTWDEPRLFLRFERFNAIAKPGYIKYYIMARRWLAAALARGEQFDVIHQMTPAAARYPSPAIGFGIPAIHGPVQGSIHTPEGFTAECNESTAWYMRLRNLDQLRMKFDPMLRRSIQSVDLMLVGSSYMRERLAPARPQRVEELVHLNIDGLLPHPERTYGEGDLLRLLYVGRVVRTKGLLDAIRALSRLKQQRVSLDVVGDGPNMNACIEEARNLGVAHLVHFHGKQPRSEVEFFYARSHALLFPSFREPAGGVVIEAMRHGLPVITTTIGGPGYYVTQACGFRISPDTPAQFAADLAKAIDSLLDDVHLYAKMSQAALDRARQLGDFDSKLRWLLAEYEQLASRHESRAETVKLR